MTLEDKIRKRIEELETVEGEDLRTYTGYELEKCIKELKALLDKK